MNGEQTFHQTKCDNHISNTFRRWRSFECFGIRLFEKIKTQTKYDIMGGEGPFWS